jgi:hypothetical protein
VLEALKNGRAFAATMTFAYQLVSAFAWFYYNVVRRLTRPFVVFAQWLWKWYRRLWDKVVYDRRGYFSRVRAGLFLTATLAFLYVLPAILLFIAQTGLFLFTKKRETVYLTYSQEILPHDDIHAVKGCEELPCTDQTSLTFRVRPSGFNHLWAFLNHRNIFFPDYVAAAVPPGVNRCEILSYGIRIKLLMRQYDIWPDLLEASCRPVDPPRP